MEVFNSHIVISSGTKVIRKISILDEELFYNSDDKSFRVLLIESPLYGGKPSRVSYSLFMLSLIRSVAIQVYSKFCVISRIKNL